jgi:hypothetical protein
MPIGLVEADNHTHLVKRHGHALQAMCGAGPIVRRLPGMWDPEDAIACRNCRTASEESG